MINAITVTNYLGESLRLELANPWDTGFVVSNVTGIEATDGDINITDMATVDGGLYNSARLNNRNVVLTLQFLDGYGKTAEELRLQTYKYFPVKKKLRLLIETDNRKAYVTGYVEKNSIGIFTAQNKREQAQISIICPDPYFYSEDKNILDFYTVDFLFEFPFSNESVEEPVIEFGHIELKKENSVFYDGDAEIGIILNIHALGTVKNLAIYNTKTRERMRIDTDILEKMTGQPIVSGDTITISTIRGNKYVSLLRVGEVINILNCLDKNADWFQLSKGDNIFSYDAEFGAMNLQFSIESQIIYEGV